MGRAKIDGFPPGAVFGCLFTGCRPVGADPVDFLQPYRPGVGWKALSGSPDAQHPVAATLELVRHPDLRYLVSPGSKVRSHRDRGLFCPYIRLPTGPQSNPAASCTPPAVPGHFRKFPDRTRRTLDKHRRGKRRTGSKASTSTGQVHFGPG